MARIAIIIIQGLFYFCFGESISYFISSILIYSLEYSPNGKAPVHNGHH
jgi:hypothetical protein